MINVHNCIPVKVEKKATQKPWRCPNFGWILDDEKKVYISSIIDSLSGWKTVSA